MTRRVEQSKELTAADALRDFQDWRRRYADLPAMVDLTSALAHIADRLTAATAPAPPGGKRGPIEYDDAVSDDLFLLTPEAAELLSADPATLRNLRYLGEGLPYYKPMGQVLYRLTDVMAAVEGRRGYSRSRFETAVRKWRGPLATAQREDLIVHVQAAMWK